MQGGTAREMATGRSAAERRYALALGVFLAGQLCFLVCLAVCLALIPRSQAANYGFTYYGAQPLTVLPFRLALLGSGLCSFVTSLLLPRARPFLAIRIVFWVMLLLLIAVVETTSYATMAIRIIHVRFGMSLFVLQGLFAIWLGAVVVRDRLTLALLALLILGGIASLLALYDVIGLFIEAQVEYEIAFGTLTYAALLRLRVRVPGKMDTSAADRGNAAI